LTGGIAHDFNNMLTVISGNLELLGDHIDEKSPANNNLVAARRAVSRGAELTQRLLAFSRQQILAPRIVDINTVIPETVTMMKRTIGEQIEVLFNPGRGLWNVRVDTGQIENALLNMCINSRDAMPEGGSITISTGNVTLADNDLQDHAYVSPGDYVRIVVTDTGEGIPPDIINRVFDPFFTTKEVGQGSGLGLSMVFGFTKQSGGYVIVDSTVGSGTSISLYFPRAVDVIEPGNKIIPSRTGQTIVGHATILLVEDQADVLEYTKTSLINMGYKVWTARNGAEAILILDDLKELDLLMTDVIMPGGIGGRELADEARDYFPQVKVLFISGYAPESVQTDIDNHEHTAFLSKPYTKDAIAEKITDLLASGQA